MVRLRPSSVSSGSTEMQFDCTEQSPQPSQTAGLISTRRCGSSIRPRLRRRRFSAAQVCTNTIAEALGMELEGDLLRRQIAVMALAAGHRDRVVVEDLVGDVGLGGDRLTNRQ